MIRPTVSISARSIDGVAADLSQRAAGRNYNRAIRAARLLEDNVEAIVRTDFDNARPPERRKPGIKLINSFKGEVVGARGDARVAARLTIKPGVNAKKIGALEHGSPPHRIAPSGVVIGGRGNLSRSRASLRRNPGLAAFGVADTQRLRFPDSRTGAEVAPLFVNHPGNRAYRMMRRARQRTVAQLKRER